MADSKHLKVSPALERHQNRGKKRKINMKGWKDNERKHLRQSGKQYTNRKGQLHDAVKAPDEVKVCGRRCNKDCGGLSIAMKTKLAVTFRLMDYDEQSSHLVQQCMEVVKPLVHRVPEDLSKRQQSFKYFVVPNNQKRFRICQKTLCDIYGITCRRLQVLQIKMKSGSVDVSDKRGQHKNRPHKIKDDVKDLIRQHIDSFPRQESHYSRHKSSKDCLSPDLSIKLMHRFFVELHPDTKVSRRTYSAVFRDEFKLRFGFPRSDTCTVCDKNYVRLSAADTEDSRQAISVESEIHHRKAEKAYESLHEDREAAKVNNSKLIVIFTDLQQVLFCPTLTHSSVFYQRQFSTYNYCIHDAGTNAATMCVWHEGVAKRGSAEISSCLLKYLTDNFQVLEPGDERKLIVWSDRCVGQNNNWRMLALFQWCVSNKLFTQIDQKFLCSGHSFLPCDRDFALIEYLKKKCMVYVPFEWIEVIVKARPSNPFTVTYMQPEDFKSLVAVESQIKRDNNLKITHAMWLRLSADDPTSIRIRKTHNVFLGWETFSLTKKKQGRSNINRPLPVIRFEELPQLYLEPVLIKPEKKKDLMDMCDLLPVNANQYKEFYENIMAE